MSVPAQVTKQQFEQHVAIYSQQALSKVILYIEKLEKEFGDDFVKVFIKQFLSAVVANIVFKKLKERPVDKKADVLVYNLKAFAGIKQDIQDAVAVGVQTAMNKYAGVDVEYYCQVKPVPEPINKKPC